MPLYFTEKKTPEYCTFPIEDGFYTLIHTQMLEGDQEVLDNCHLKPFVLLLAPKSYTFQMSLVLLLLSGCYKTMNSFTPNRDKNLLLREWEKNKMGGTNLVYYSGFWLPNLSFIQPVLISPYLISPMNNLNIMFMEQSI